MKHKMASADHKKIVTTMMEKIYEDFRRLRPDEAREFVKDFGATAWLDLLKTKSWKRREKKTSKAGEVTHVRRVFTADSPKGVVHMSVTEVISPGETVPERTNISFDFYPAELSPIIHWAQGATATIVRDEKGVSVGETNLKSESSTGFTRGPGESILDTPKPEGFGAFG